MRTKQLFSAHRPRVLPTAAQRPGHPQVVLPEGQRGNPDRQGGQRAVPQGRDQPQGGGRGSLQAGSRAGTRVRGSRAGSVDCFNLSLYKFI